jgi:polyferredoxin
MAPRSSDVSRSRNEAGSEAEAEFARRASRRSPGIVREFWLFLRDNKKWWLTPVILVLLLVALLIVLGGSAAAPFIYTLF